jgi:hypothetical protein
VASSIEVIASTTAASLGLERALAFAPPSTLLQGEAAAAVRGRSHEVGVEEERGGGGGRKGTWVWMDRDPVTWIGFVTSFSYRGLFFLTRRGFFSWPIQR